MAAAVNNPTWRAHLEKANRAREDRAAIKRRLESGEIKARDVLLAGLVDGEPAVDVKVVERMRVRAILEALPRIGEVKATETLRTARVNGELPLKRVTTRQRLELLDALKRYRSQRAD